MFFDKFFFTLLAFIAINFLIIFAVQSRTSTVIGLIISHLVAILFFSLSINNYEAFKEITLGLVVYSMVILFLISNYTHNSSALDQDSKVKASQPSIFFIAAIALPLLVIFFLSLAVAQNINFVAESTHEKKFKQQSEAAGNPMILPSHPVHIAVKEFYLGKKFSDELPEKIDAQNEISNHKRARLKDKLADNFLLKRSSDVIFIIVSASAVLLLLSTNSSKENS